MKLRISSGQRRNYRHQASSCLENGEAGAGPIRNGDVDDIVRDSVSVGISGD